MDNVNQRDILLSNSNNETGSTNRDKRRSEWVISTHLDMLALLDDSVKTRELLKSSSHIQGQCRIFLTRLDKPISNRFLPVEEKSKGKKKSSSKRSGSVDSTINHNENSNSGDDDDGDENDEKNGNNTPNTPMGIWLQDGSHLVHYNPFMFKIMGPSSVLPSSEAESKYTADDFTLEPRFAAFEQYSIQKEEFDACTAKGGIWESASKFKSWAYEVYKLEIEQTIEYKVTEWAQHGFCRLDAAEFKGLNRIKQLLALRHQTNYNSEFVMMNSDSSQDAQKLALVRRLSQSGPIGRNNTNGDGNSKKRKRDERMNGNKSVPASVENSLDSNDPATLRIMADLKEKTNFNYLSPNSQKFYKETSENEKMAANFWLSEQAKNQNIESLKSSECVSMYKSFKQAVAVMSHFVGSSAKCVRLTTSKIANVLKKSMEDPELIAKVTMDTAVKSKTGSGVDNNGGSGSKFISMLDGENTQDYVDSSGEDRVDSALVPDTMTCTEVMRYLLLVWKEFMRITDDNIVDHYVIHQLCDKQMESTIGNVGDVLRFYNRFRNDVHSMNKPLYKHSLLYPIFPSMFYATPMHLCRNSAALFRVAPRWILPIFRCLFNDNMAKIHWIRSISSFINYMAVNDNINFTLIKSLMNLIYSVDKETVNAPTRTIGRRLTLERLGKFTSTDACEPMPLLAFEQVYADSKPHRLSISMFLRKCTSISPSTSIPHNIWKTAVAVGMTRMSHYTGRLKLQIEMYKKQIKTKTLRIPGYFYMTTPRLVEALTGTYTGLECDPRHSLYYCNSMRKKVVARNNVSNREAVEWEPLCSVSFGGESDPGLINNQPLEEGERRTFYVSNQRHFNEWMHITEFISSNEVYELIEWAELMKLPTAFDQSIAMVGAALRGLKRDAETGKGCLVFVPQLIISQLAKTLDIKKPVSSRNNKNRGNVNMDIDDKEIDNNDEDDFSTPNSRWIMAWLKLTEEPFTLCSAEDVNDILINDFPDMPTFYIPHSESMKNYDWVKIIYAITEKKKILATRKSTKSNSSGNHNKKAIIYTSFSPVLGGVNQQMVTNLDGNVFYMFMTAETSDLIRSVHTNKVSMDEAIAEIGDEYLLPTFGWRTKEEVAHAKVVMDRLKDNSRFLGVSQHKPLFDFNTLIETPNGRSINHRNIETMKTVLLFCQRLLGVGYDLADLPRSRVRNICDNRENLFQMAIHKSDMKWPSVVAEYLDHVHTDEKLSVYYETDPKKPTLGSDIEEKIDIMSKILADYDDDDDSMIIENKSNTKKDSHHLVHSQRKTSKSNQIGYNDNLHIKIPFGLACIQTAIPYYHVIEFMETHKDYTEARIIDFKNVDQFMKINPLQLASILARMRTHTYYLGRTPEDSIDMWSHYVNIWLKTGFMDFCGTRFLYLPIPVNASLLGITSYDIKDAIERRTKIELDRKKYIRENAQKVESMEIDDESKDDEDDLLVNPLTNRNNPKSQTLASAIRRFIPNKHTTPVATINNTFVMPKSVAAPTTTTTSTVEYYSSASSSLYGRNEVVRYISDNEKGSEDYFDKMELDKDISEQETKQYGNELEEDIVVSDLEDEELAPPSLKRLKLTDPTKNVGIFSFDEDTMDAFDI